MRPVAVVGVGAMGSRMARRLLDAGYEVLVWNRSPERLGPLLELGAVATATPREAAERAEVLLTMLADPQALQAVTEGENGIAGGASPALTVIEMSTVGSAAVARLASALPAGTGLLDAPVLGSLGEVESGSLTILAGGPPDLVEQATPLLVNFGAVIHVGGLGSGAAAKLVANATLLTVVTTLGEVIGLARGLGLQDDAIAAVLGRTPLADQADRRLRAIEAGDYPPRFPLSLARKDAELIRDAATAAGMRLRLAEATRSWLADAEAAGRGDRDYTVVLATILDAMLE